MHYHLQLLGMTINFHATLDEIIIGESTLDLFISKLHTCSIIRNEVNPGKFTGLGSLALH